MENWTINDPIYLFHKSKNPVSKQIEIEAKLFSAMAETQRFEASF